MNQPILILGHWHTASSLLSFILFKCGMWVGNNKTDWIDDCILNTEHSGINGAGDRIEKGEEIRKNRDYIQKIMHLYQQEVHKLGHAHYGFKITHALQINIWPYIRHIFLHTWINPPIIIIPIQHPMNIIKSLRTRPHGFEWSDERIMKSWLSIRYAILELLPQKNVYVVDTPISYRNNNEKIKSLVEKIGLKWSEECDNLFSEERNIKFSEEEQSEFMKRFPKEVELYKLIAGDALS